MTDIVTDDAAAVRDQALAALGLPQAWAEPGGYPHSLALSAIDAVYSLRARQAAVVTVLDTYRSLRRSQGADPYQDSGADLLAAVDGAGGPEAAAAVLFNNAKAPGVRPPLLRSVALAAAVAALGRVGVDTAADLRDASPSTLAAARTTWVSVRGNGPLSWEYLQMNVGVQGAGDATVLRWVTRAVGASRPVSTGRANAAVQGAADVLEVPRHALHHRIWWVESGRD